MLDPCLMVRLPVRLRPGESCALRLALGVSDRLDAAADTAQRLLEGREEPGGMLAPLPSGWGWTRSGPGGLCFAAPSGLRPARSGGASAPV